jgi:hypothetical protein
MASFAAQPIQGAAECGVHLLMGRLCVAAAGAVTAATTWFKGGTFTKGANGEYTLQLEAKYRGVSATAGTAVYGLTKAAAGLQGVEWVSKDFLAGTFVIRFIETAVAGAGTDPAAAVELDIQIMLINSTLPKG